MGTTYTGVIENVQFIGKDVAVVDVAGEVNGMVGPDGKPAPAFKHHVTWIAEKKNGKWMAVAARASGSNAGTRAGPVVGGNSCMNHARFVGREASDVSRR